MIEITEDRVSGGLKCRFPNGWHAIKYDESEWHKKHMKSQLNAMDILATDGSHHWWIEIKDCEGYEPDNQPRLSPIDPEEVQQTRQWVQEKGWDRQVAVRRKKSFIVDEVVEKFRQTLMAIAGAERDQHAGLDHYWVICSSRPLSVVLLLTWNDRDFKRLAARLQEKLEKALSCYGVNAYVINGTPPSSMGLKMTIKRA